MASKRDGKLDPSMMAVGVLLGLSIGVAIGISQSQLGLWIVVGLAMGFSFGVALSAAKKEEADDQRSPTDRG